MSEFFAWAEQNWFGLIQSIGILGSLLLAGAAFRREARARRVSDTLLLNEQHRELWTELHRRPDLGRIMQDEVNFVAEPMSLAEREFLNLVIEHYRTGFLLAHEGIGNRLEVIQRDAEVFFKKPLPSRYWKETEQERDPEFVEFINRALGGN